MAVICKSKNILNSLYKGTKTILFSIVCAEKFFLGTFAGYGLDSFCANSSIMNRSLYNKRKKNIVGVQYQ